MPFTNRVIRLLAVLLVLALTPTSARPHASNLESFVARDDNICQQANNPGIFKPANGSTVIISVEDQFNYQTTFEVIYCSDAYFKTSPVNITSWMSYAWNPSSGELLAAGIGPDWSIATPGFGGYRFNVTLNPPDDGSWDEYDGRILFVQEVQTGYYYEYGVELWSASFSFALETATTTVTSSTSVGTLSINCKSYPFLCPSSTTSSSSTTSTTTAVPVTTSSSKITTIATSVSSSVGKPIIGTNPTSSPASTTKTRRPHGSTSKAAPKPTAPPYPYPSYVQMSPGMFLA